MKLKINKKSLKDLSNSKLLPQQMTPNVGGAYFGDAKTRGTTCDRDCTTVACGTDVYYGCVTNSFCYSGTQFRGCHDPRI
ncbi:hypothetical protein ACSLBF_04415 [Pseudoalteromonas sp. T1lg65]|uniref:hypothetical protein n=1 Tax=Pseudoalteromonas sp. T1lg65 TaxID=2077101 RepID=UPI003F7A05CD